MTLCGWKIFTKSKQKSKCTKNEATVSTTAAAATSSSSSSSSSASKVLQKNVTSIIASSSSSASSSLSLSVQPYKLSEPSSKLPNICETISSDVPLPPANSNSKGNNNTSNTKKKQIKNFKLKKIKSTSQTFEDIRRIKDEDDDDYDDRNNDVINKKKIKKKGMSKSDAEDDDDDDEKYTENDGLGDGNPRNKCALKPGHSLMDWIRLGSSGCDLTGTNGVIRPVSSSELQLHCKKDDAWLSIRGKVYNVTHYMDFHPGGSDELMKGVGKDATKMFDEIHAWVNYEQLLSKCYIGPLQNIVTVDLEPARRSFRKHQKTSSANGGSIKISSSSIVQPPLFTGTSSAKTSPIKYDTKSISNTNLSEDINPRFDWIQKTSDLVLIFYTKSFCNPGLIITIQNDCDFIIKIVIERMTYMYNLKLLREVKWPGIAKLYSETGKIEINFTKCKPELWINYGTMEYQKFYNADDLCLNYEIIEKQQITHDSYAICLKSCDKTIMITPIGYHVSVTALINEIDVTRSYTPVPGNYLPMNCSNICIGFLIKSYVTGTLAKYLTSLSVNNNKSISSSTQSTLSPTSSSSSSVLSPVSSSPNSSHIIVNLSQPKGNFILKKLLNHYRIGLLAAGSGITAMLSVLDHLLTRSTNRIESIQFLFFNKTEKDIWCRQKLESIATKDKRLNIRHILSEPDINWNGEKGRITKKLIETLNDKKSELYVTYCCICGPTQFNDLSLKLLKDIGFELINLHFFQG